MMQSYGITHHKFKEYLEEGEPCTEVYFSNAVIWLGCENLFRDLLSSSDPGHLTKGFEWFDVQTPSDSQDRSSMM